MVAFLKEFYCAATKCSLSLSQSLNEMEDELKNNPITDSQNSVVVDDDTPTLSSETLEALKEFLAEQNGPPDVNHNLQMHSSLVRRLSLEKVMERHQGCVNVVAWNSKGLLLISGLDDTRTLVLVIDVGVKEIEGWTVRLLPSRQFGYILLTTSTGIMDYEEARRENVGASKKAGRLPQLLSRLSAKLRGKEWEPPQSPLASSSFISSKLIPKVLIVAGVAVLWQYYSE